MKGEILDVAGDRGLIAGADGRRYGFGPAAWRAERAPLAGMSVDFVADGSDAADIYPEVGADDDPPVEGTASNGSLVPRLKSLMLQPRVEWQAIGAEKIGVGKLLGETALLSAIAFLIVAVQFAAVFGFFFAVLPPTPQNGAPLPTLPIIFLIGAGVAVFMIGVNVLAALFRVTVEALVARFVAPGFDGRASYSQALKLITFATTPMWLALMVPVAGLFLQWIGWGYSIYQIHAGSGPVLGVPRSKRVVFTTVTVIGSWTVSIILMFALYFLIYIAFFGFVMAMAGGAAAAGAAAGK